MKVVLLVIGSLLSCTAFGQTSSSQISTVDFVEILNANREEAIFYFENNWKVLREMAIVKGYIESYQLLTFKPSPETPFQILLITTYKDEHQYAEREKNFEELIAVKGELKLLNEKKPTEFRKTVFSKETIY